MNSREALEDAVRRGGGQTATSEKLGVRQSLIWYWLKRSKKGVAPEYVLPLEKLTGVSRSALRPDLFPNEEKDTAA